MKHILFIISSLFLYFLQMISQIDFLYDDGKKVLLTKANEKIIIKFKNDIDFIEIDNLLNSNEAFVKIIERKNDFYIVSLKDKIDLKQLFTKLISFEAIEYANPVYIYEGREFYFINEFIVHFNENVSLKSIEALNKKYNVEIINRNPAEQNIYTFRIKKISGLSTLNVINEYYEILSCKWALPNFYLDFKLDDFPVDEFFNDQYYLNWDNIYSWNITKGHSSITIAVIDEGIISHEDLTNLWLNSDEFPGDYNYDGYPGIRNVDDDNDGKIDEDSQGRQPGEEGYNNDLKNDDDENGYNDDINGWDFKLNDNNPAPDGNEAHGMACAGIITANHNTIGVAGIAPHCKVMAIKISDKNGDGLLADQMVSSIDYAWRNKADIISISWHFPTANPFAIGYRPLKEAIDRALTQGRGGKGCVIVASAGNTANRSIDVDGYVAFPACVPGVIAVGAIDRSDNPLPRNYSPKDDEISVVMPSGGEGTLSSYECEGEQIESSTLGGDIWTLDIPGSYGYNPGDYRTYSPFCYNKYTANILPSSNNYTASFSGTSASCPQVSGIAALMLSICPVLKDEDVKDIIEQTADNLGNDGGFDKDYGWGRANVYEALKNVLENYSTTIGGTGKIVTFIDNITTKSGTSLTIQPGTIVKFEQTRRLTANGRVIAEGTLNSPITFTSEYIPQAGAWYGIDLKGGPNSLKYCDIQYATYGVVVNSTAGTTIENCNISNSLNYGVYGLNAFGYGALRIKLTNLTNNTSGIGLQNAWASLENGTKIGPTSNYAFYVNNSYVYMGNTIIENSSYPGMWVTGSGSDVFLSPNGYSPGWNKIRNNTSKQIWVTSDANVFIGSKRLVCMGDQSLQSSASYISSEDPCQPPSYWDWVEEAGYNYISGNGYWIYNNSSPIYAHLTYWGNPPNCTVPASKFLGTVYRDYPLCFDPPATALFSGEGDIANEKKDLYFNYQVTDTAKIISLIKYLKRLISEKPDSAENALQELLPLVGPCGKFTNVLDVPWEEFLTRVSQTSTSEKIRDRATIYRIQTRMFAKDYDNVILLANATLAKKPKDNLWFYCQYQKIASYIMMGKISVAEEVYWSMISKGMRIDPHSMTEIRRMIDMSVGVIPSSSDPAAMATSTISPEDNFNLSSNYPNPFNPMTTINYTLPEDAHVSLYIYNVLGQVVKTIVDEYQTAGQRSVTIDINDLPSGVYFYKLQTEKYSSIKKMLLVR